MIRMMGMMIRMIRIIRVTRMIRMDKMAKLKHEDDMISSRGTPLMPQHWNPAKYFELINKIVIQCQHNLLQEWGSK